MTITSVSMPKTATELFDRAHAIAGLSLGELAVAIGHTLPQDTKRAKGCIGQLLESALGAYAGSQAKADFFELGIELKTLPVDAQYKPCESTYVCMLPLQPGPEQHWHSSVVLQKLSHVLFFPFDGRRLQPLAQRRLLRPFLWQPSPATRAQLQSDFDEIMELVTLGDIESITARVGTLMQVRPKAMHAKVLSYYVNAEGERVQTLPRGFYLRTQFTHQIVQEHYDHCHHQP